MTSTRPDTGTHGLRVRDDRTAGLYRALSRFGVTMSIYRRLFLSLPLVLVAFAAACSSGGSDFDSPFPVELTNERVAIGAGVYDANCAACHGEIGSLPLLPGAPSHGVNGHTWHHDDRQLFGWVLDRPPNATVMPGFRGMLSDEDVMAVLAYMKSRWPKEIRDIQTAQTSEYEKSLRRLEAAGG